MLPKLPVLRVSYTQRCVFPFKLQALCGRLTCSLQSKCLVNEERANRNIELFNSVLDTSTCMSPGRMNCILSTLGHHQMVTCPFPIPTPPSPQKNKELQLFPHFLLSSQVLPFRFFLFFSGHQNKISWWDKRWVLEQERPRFCQILGLLYLSSPGKLLTSLSLSFQVCKMGIVSAL